MSPKHGKSARERSKRRIVGVVGLLALLVLAGCGFRYEWNHKVTVTVLTPEGEVSASSVQQVRYSGRKNWRVAGEAVILALPNGRYLFALLRGHDNQADSGGSLHHIFQVAVAPQFGARTQEALAAADAAPVGKVFEVRGKTPPWRGVTPPRPGANFLWGGYDDRPLLVTFKDLADPKSVKRVNIDALSETFGPGYALKSITIQKTDEDVTLGQVRTVLPWLDEYFNKMLDGRRLETIEATDRFANSLSSSTFSTDRDEEQ